MEMHEEMKSVSNPKTMSHEDRNIQQAKVVVKENHDTVPAGSNQTTSITQKQHSEAFHRPKFLTFQTVTIIQREVTWKEEMWKRHILLQSTLQ